MRKGRDRNVYVLNEIHYDIEFTSKPSEGVIQTLLYALKKG